MVWPKARLAAAGLMAGVLLGGTAWADGAFPDGQSIMVPADRPGQILIATNFGVVDSEDGGRSWIWSCEQPANSYGRLYQLGPGPAHRMFAVAGGKLVMSDDRSCGWRTAAGSLAAASCQDAFADPGDATHVVAVALTFGDGGPSYTVVDSHDGGLTFGAPLYTADTGDLITGVEIAASDPAAIVVALSHGSQLLPALARSNDGGATWQVADLSGTLGSAQVRIAAVDPVDDDRVYLRALGTDGDALAIAASDGSSVVVPVRFANGQLTAFVRTSGGTILAAGTSAGTATLFRSDDGGTSFAALANPPAILALAERAGVVYAVTDTASEPFAEATSMDGGMTWTPGLQFKQVQAIASCLAAACQTDCHTRAAQGQWPVAMCSAVPADSPDGGVAGDGGLQPAVVDAVGPTPVDAAVDATVVRTTSDASTRRVDAGDVQAPHVGLGCSCAVDSGHAGGPVALLCLAAFVARRRRRAA